MLTKFKQAGMILPTLLAIPALVLLFGLGQWQWQRKAWKEDLVATIDARAAAAPIAAAQWPSLNCRAMHEAGLAQSCEFTMVKLAGRFEHAGERYVFTSAPAAGSGPSGPGYWVLTPFELDTGGRIFVNRGFVPEPLKDATRREAGQIADHIELTGQIRTAEQRSTFSGENSPAAKVWFLRNPRELLALGPADAAPAGWVGTGPNPLEFYVEQIEPAPPGGLPAPRKSRIELPNRHLEYALTWWSLGLTLIGVYVAFAISRVRGRA